MTTRLFYDDAYLTSFTAVVVDRGMIQGQHALALDRTAFFPAGGGQPGDSGTLNDAAVTELRASNGVIWHLLDRPVSTATVEGCIDWPKRWDHMQNHSGQHILSQAFIVATGAMTVAWRLSPNSLTIDLDCADLPAEAVAEAEHLSNMVVQENRSINSRLVDESELRSLSLRKQPDVEGALRIVEIAGFDRVACSGTHVGSTAQVGLIKIVRAERRGPETRIHFACGQRAVVDYGRKHRLVRDLAARFTCSEDELTESVARLQDEAQRNFKALKAAQQALVAGEAERLSTPALGRATPRLVVGFYPSWEDDQLKALALALKSHPGMFIALAGGRSNLVFAARSADVETDANQSLRHALGQVGGRGGGRPDFAQGSAATPEAAKAALDLIAAHIQPEET